jgi:hypothetical protein
MFFIDFLRFRFYLSQRMKKLDSNPVFYQEIGKRRLPIPNKKKFVKAIREYYRSQKKETTKTYSRFFMDESDVAAIMDGKFLYCL